MASGTRAGSAGVGSEMSTTGDGMFCDWMSGGMMFGGAMTGDGTAGAGLTGTETAAEGIVGAVPAVGKVGVSAAAVCFAEEASCACTPFDGPGAEADSTGRCATRTSG